MRIEFKATASIFAILLSTGIAQANDLETNAYDLQMMAQIFDGERELSHSQTSTVVRARKDNESYTLMDFGDGSVVVEQQGLDVAASSFRSSTGVEAEFKYNYDTQTLSGANEFGSYFNSYIRPNLNKSPAQGSDAQWDSEVSMGALDVDGIRGESVKIELKRNYFTYEGKDLVLLHYQVPAFAYRSASGQDVVHWGEGVAVSDPGFGEIYWNATHQRAMAVEPDGTKRPYRFLKTLAAKNTEGIPLIDPRDIDEVEPYFDKIYGAGKTGVMGFVGRPGKPDQSPILMAAKLDMMALSLAENSANQTPQITFQYTVGSNGNLKTIGARGYTDGGAIVFGDSNGGESGVFAEEAVHTQGSGTQSGDRNEPTPDDNSIESQAQSDTSEMQVPSTADVIDDGIDDVIGGDSGTETGTETDIQTYGINGPPQGEAGIYDISIDDAKRLLQQARGGLNASGTESPLRDAINHPSAVEMLDNLRANGLDPITVFGQQDLSPVEQIQAVLEAGRDTTLNNGLEMPSDTPEIQVPSADDIRYPGSTGGGGGDGNTGAGGDSTGAEGAAAGVATEDVTTRVDENGSIEYVDLDEYQSEYLEAQREEAERREEERRERIENGTLTIDPVEFDPPVWEPPVWDPPVWAPPEWKLPEYDDPGISIIDFTEFSGNEDYNEINGTDWFGPAANLAYLYQGLSGTVATDLAPWAEWLATQNLRELTRIALTAGYPNLASALADAKNLMRQANDAGYRQWAGRAPVCYMACAGLLGQWHIKASQLALGDILNDSREIFSTVGLSDISMSGFTLRYILRDFGLEDGDDINIVISQFGRSIFETDLSLLNAGTDFEINLRPGVASIVITALDEGDISPNTAEISLQNVVEGEAVQTYSLLEGETATLRVNPGRVGGIASSTATNGSVQPTVSTTPSMIDLSRNLLRGRLGRDAQTEGLQLFQTNGQVQYTAPIPQRVQPVMVAPELPMEQLRRGRLIDVSEIGVNR